MIAFSWDPPLVTFSHVQTIQIVVSLCCKLGMNFAAFWYPQWTLQVSLKCD